MMLLAAVGGVAVLGVAVVGVWYAYASSVEEPAYRSVEADGAIEVRDYPALVVAELTRSGDRWEAVRAGFGPLARYIFARDRAGDGIAMTAPVTQSREKIPMTAPVTQSRESGANGAAADDTWVVRFIMPAKYTLDELPAPGSADVRLEQVPARRVAAIRFSGVATDELIAEQEARLAAWLENRGLERLGTPTYAYYNDPWTPGFLRRNEVMWTLR